MEAIVIPLKLNTPQIDHKEAKDLPKLKKKRRVANSPLFLPTVLFFYIPVLVGTILLVASLLKSLL